VLHCNGVLQCCNYDGMWLIIFRVPVMHSLVHWLSTCRHSQICHFMTLYREQVRLLLGQYLRVALRRVSHGVLSFRLNYSVLTNITKQMTVCCRINMNWLPQHNLTVIILHCGPEKLYFLIFWINQSKNEPILIILVYRILKKFGISDYEFHLC